MNHHDYDIMSYVRGIHVKFLKVLKILCARRSFHASSDQEFKC